MAFFFVCENSWISNWLKFYDFWQFFYEYVLTKKKNWWNIRNCMQIKICAIFFEQNLSSQNSVIISVFLHFFQSKEASCIRWWQRKVIDRDSRDVRAVECATAVEHWISVACHTGIHSARYHGRMVHCLQAASLRLFKF